jgi:hypothetical protein
MELTTAEREQYYPAPGEDLVLPVESRAIDTLEGSSFDQFGSMLAERSLGLAAATTDKSAADRAKKEEPTATNGKKKRRRRPTVRALQAARALHAEAAESPALAAEEAASDAVTGEGARVGLNSRGDV